MIHGESLKEECKMDCFGKYNYKKIECLFCEKRLECMAKKFDQEDSVEWFDSSDKPACFGSFKGKDCKECQYLKECTRISVDLKRNFLRKGKKQRLVSKYKERGSWDTKNYY